LIVAVVLVAAFAFGPFGAMSANLKNINKLNLDIFMNTNSDFYQETLLYTYLTIESKGEAI